MATTKRFEAGYTRGLATRQFPVQPLRVDASHPAMRGSARFSAAVRPERRLVGWWVGGWVGWLVGWLVGW
jgi:hypothetical protein